MCLPVNKPSICDAQMAIKIKNYFKMLTCDLKISKVFKYEVKK